MSGGVPWGWAGVVKHKTKGQMKLAIRKEKLNRCRVDISLERLDAGHVGDWGRRNNKRETQRNMMVVGGGWGDLCERIWDRKMGNVTGREKVAFVEERAAADESELWTLAGKQTEGVCRRNLAMGGGGGVGGVEWADHCWFHMSSAPQPQLAYVKTGNKWTHG